MCLSVQCSSQKYSLLPPSSITLSSHPATQHFGRCILSSSTISFVSSDASTSLISVVSPHLRQIISFGTSFWSTSTLCLSSSTHSAQHTWPHFSLCASFTRPQHRAQMILSSNVSGLFTFIWTLSFCFIHKFAKKKLIILSFVFKGMSFCNTDVAQKFFDFSTFPKYEFIVQIN